MDLFTSLTEKLTKTYNNYKTKVESINGVDYFVIANPFWEENIKISAEDGIIFYFSFQHAHFDFSNNIDDNINYLIEYINDFLEEKRAIIEFLAGDENLFGGDKYQDYIDTTSGEALLKSFIGDDPESYEPYFERFKGVNLRCSLRSWNGSFNKDVDFVL